MKQAARKWYKKLPDFIIENTLHNSSTEPCFFSWKDLGTLYNALTWVDYILTKRNTHETVKNLEGNLSGEFKMEDREKAFSCVENNIKRNSHEYTPREFYWGVFEEDCKPSKTPAEVNLKLERVNEQESKNNETGYRIVVGSLLNVSKQTRPDIIWITNQSSRPMQIPTSQHWTASKRVLRYL